MATPYKPERPVSSAKIKELIVQKIVEVVETGKLRLDHWNARDIASKAAWSRLFRAKLPDSKKNVRGYVCRTKLSDEAQAYSCFICVSNQDDSEILETYFVKDAATERTRLGVEEIILG